MSSPLSTPTLAPLMSLPAYGIERAPEGVGTSGNEASVMQNLTNAALSATASSVASAANEPKSLFGRTVAHIRSIPASVTSLFSRVASSISAWAQTFASAVFSCFSASKAGSSAANEGTSVPSGQHTPRSAASAEGGDLASAPRGEGHIQQGVDTSVPSGQHTPRSAASAEGSKSAPPREESAPASTVTVYRRGKNR